MVMVLELLVMSHTIHIDRAREKTYRNSKEVFFRTVISNPAIVWNFSGSVRTWFIR